MLDERCRFRVVLVLVIIVPMPAVGMRRTRVFGLRSVDGARVLRSGRRVCADSGEVKLKKFKDNITDWYPVIDNRGNGGGIGQGRFHGRWQGVRSVRPKRVVVVDIRKDDDDDDCVAELPKPVKVLEARINGNGESDDVDSMFGKVYTRKRKRDFSVNGGALDEMEGDEFMSGDRMFGLQFIRRQRSKKNDVEQRDQSNKLHFLGPSILSLPSPPWDRVLTMLSGSKHSDGSFSDVILSVLEHLKSLELGVAKVSEFLLSNPIHGVFASKGMRFLQNYPPIRSSGMCVIFGAIQSIPIFHLNFSAVPLSFMHLHSKILLRATWIQTRLVYNNRQLDVDIRNDSEVDSVEEQYVSSPGSSLESNDMSSRGEHFKTRPISRPSVRAPTLGSRTMQYRNGFSPGCIRKRRSSLGVRRPTSFSLAALQKAFGSLSADDIKHSVSSRSAASCNRRKNLAPRESAGRIKEASSAALGSAMDVDSSCCKANILILESNKCLREEGADIALEFSASADWLLVVKKGGSTRYTYKAENVMKPSSCNRFTHAMLWSSDNGWKLEFPNRRDWFIFKDLYKKCSDRNILCSTSKAIPVPKVSEVPAPGYVDSSGSFFRRPETYISVKDDELCRAMVKITANYDMDSDDEEWLNKFNNELIATDKHHDCISVDNFELMIDAFEKESFCDPDVFSDEKAPAEICLHLGSRSVVESLFTYWMMKRKQRKSCLISVFQAHQVKKQSLVVPKSIIRRKRSLKRQSCHSGYERATQSSTLEAVASRQDDVKNAMLKYEEAKAAADKCVEVAVSKRRRAQLLMEDADFAIQKATMALRIADLLKAEAAAGNIRS